MGRKGTIYHNHHMELQKRERHHTGDHHMVPYGAFSAPYGDFSFPVKTRRIQIWNFIRSKHGILSHRLKRCF